MAKKNSTAEDQAPQPKYEEWRMEKKIVKDEDGVTVVSVERLKKVREGINITEDEAANWNEGMLSPGAINPVMYLLPDEDTTLFTRKFKGR